MEDTAAEGIRLRSVWRMNGMVDAMMFALLPTVELSWREG
jgi:hypothetical protein